LAGAGALARFGIAAQQDTATPTAAQNSTPKIVSAAYDFLSTLSDSQKDSVLFDWTDTAQKQRWSNLPQGGFQRDGLMWGDLSEE
jgi:Protein of unknown function (DUF3500)